VDETLYPTSAVGYRAWRLHGANLRPLVVSSPWQPGLNSADCDKEEHQAPQHSCVCGLYAFHSLDQAQLAGGQIIGIVEAYGRIEVHHDGFRAQYMEPKALYCPVERLHKDARRAAERYQVPLVDSLMELREFELEGEIIPKEIRPAPPASSKRAWYILFAGLIFASALALFSQLLVFALFGGVFAMMIAGAAAEFYQRGMLTRLNLAASLGLALTAFLIALWISLLMQ
jgi:hypothetical protein